MTDIWKIFNEQIVLVLNVTLVGAGAVIMLVLLPMVFRYQGLEGQEGLLNKDSSLVNNLIKGKGIGLPDPPMITLNDASRVMQEIVDLGNEGSITFISVINQDKSKISYKKINTLPVDLEVQGTYKQLGRFMGSLNELRRGIILVDSFQMKADKDAADKVRAKILLYICLRSTSKAPKTLKDSLASHQEALSLIKDYSSTGNSSKTAREWDSRNPFLAEAVLQSSKQDIKQVKEKKETAFVYSLSGIFWNEEKPSAIINGLVVEIGSAIGPSIVKEIGPNKVVLFDGKKEIVLDLMLTERI